MRLDHIGFVVDSIEEAAEIFRALGLKEITRPVENPLQRVSASFVNVGGNKDIYIEILEPSQAKSPVTGFLEQKGGGLHHLCFEVDDIEESSARLVQKGYRMVVPPQDCRAYDKNLDRECDGVTKIAFFVVSDKMLIELIQKG